MLDDNYYPTVDLSFLEEVITKCGNVIPESRHKIGKTIMYVKTGVQSMNKRLILLRELDDNQISYYQATGLAITLGFLSELMEWFKVNRGWVEGAHSVQASQN